ncbi:MAG: glycosyltransferase family 2 protein [Janthinobacterium lividum]
MSPSTSPRVTIAVPVYNSASTLERALRSALRQTLSDIEILVLDDGSTDDGAAIVERLAAEDSRIRLIRAAANAGKPAAMNRMVDEARGEWFAVLDADDAYADDRLDSLLQAATRHGAEIAADNITYVDGGADAVVGTAFPLGQADRVVGIDDFWAHSDPHAEFDFGILKPVIRRDFLRRHGLRYFDTALSEDFYYLMKAFQAGGKAVLTGRATYFWTMPFGPLSRAWTGTGNGAWRYDYRQALQANRHFLAEAKAGGDDRTAAMLTIREHQYHVMKHYLDAQRAAAEGRWARSLSTIVAHPSTYGLLLKRVTGRLRRVVSPPPPPPPAAAHPRLRA